MDNVDNLVHNWFLAQTGQGGLWIKFRELFTIKMWIMWISVGRTQFLCNLPVKGHLGLQDCLQILTDWGRGGKNMGKINFL